MHCPLRRRLLAHGTRIATRPLRNSTFYRHHHSATGKFITISPDGTPIAREVKVWLGDAENAYVMFNPEISHAFRTTYVLQNGSSPTQDPDLTPLVFHHESRHFSHKSAPFPRLEIPEDLPKQSKANSSPAILHAYGVTHAITLDGTQDAAFHDIIKEALPQWQPVLDALKKT